MAILVSHLLAIRWKSALGGSWNAGTNLGVCAKPFGDSVPLARFLSFARASPSGSKICGGAVLRRRAQESIRRRHRARSVGESLESERDRQEPDDWARPYSFSFASARCR